MSGRFYGRGATGLRWRAVAAGAFATLACGVQGQTLLQAWDRAAAGEPALQAARANHRAAIERTAQARAVLYPQLDFSYNRQKNHRESILLPEVGFPETEERYPTRSTQVNVTQPLYRPQNWAALQQALEIEEQAGLQAVAAEQELQTRFVQAWFELMSARDTLLHAGEQLDAARQQAEVMQRGLALGTQSEVQASEAVARMEQAVAERVAAQAELEAKLALLEQLTGPLPGFEPPLLSTAAASALNAPVEPLAAWVARAEADNPGVRAAQRGLQAAQREVDRQHALHLPTVDLVARASRNLQGAGTSPGQSGYKSREHYFGVQANVPIFTGGGTQAKVREAQAMMDKASHDLDAARRNAVAQAHQGWASARAAQGRMQAAEHAVRAAEIALRAAGRGQSTGLRTVLDELQARQQLAAAQRDQQRARYDRAVGLARLRAAAGNLDAGFLAQVEALLDRATGGGR
jgi:outer membrane protein